MFENLYEKGLEDYPLTTVIGQNLFFIAYFVLGIVGMWNLKLMKIPVISILYALFLIIMLIFVLRKHLCTNCYYYGKRCNTGWGKLAKMMFEKDSGHYKLGVKLAGITWGLATLIPIIGIITVLIFKFELYLLAILFLFILLTPINFTIHKHSCTKCKMRNICPASMVKSKGGEI